MRIPLPKLMRHWRERQFERGLQPATYRRGLKSWAFVAQRPTLYRWASRMAVGVLARLGAGRGRFASLPLAGGWTKHRDFPAPQGGSFVAQWNARRTDR